MDRRRRGEDLLGRGVLHMDEPVVVRCPVVVQCPVVEEQLGQLSHLPLPLGDVSSQAMFDITVPVYRGLRLRIAISRPRPAITSICCLGLPIRAPILAKYASSSSEGHRRAVHTADYVYDPIMPISGDGFQIVGVTIAGCGPLGTPIDLEMDTGVHVLYGLNGSGKTSALRLVEAALTGEARSTWTADAHLRVTQLHKDPDAHFVRELLDGLRESVNMQRGTMYASERFDEFDILDEESRFEISPSIAEVLETLIRLKSAESGFDDSQLECLLHLAKQGLFTFRARENGTWEVWLSSHVASKNLFNTALQDRISGYSKLFATAPDSNTYHENIVTLDMIRNLDTPMLHSSIAQSYCDARHPILPSATLSDGVWPNWLQVPVIKLINSFTAGPAVLIGGAIPPTELNESTLNTIVINAAEDYDASFANGSTDYDYPPPSYLAAACEETSSRANTFLKIMLSGSPGLSFDLKGPNDWLMNDRPEWTFQAKTMRRPSGYGEKLDGLSTAQFRWATLAIQLALSTVRHDGLPVLFICDEPEQGLHKTAERRIPSALFQLSSSEGLNVLVATHSAHLISNPDTKPVHVREQQPGRVVASPLNASLRSAFSIESSSARLGLTRGDMMLMMKAVIVVEGLHDKYVLEALIGDQLDQQLAKVIPMHGGIHAASLAEAEFLFLASDAAMIVVLDNTSHDLSSSFWKKIQEKVARGEIGIAHELASELKNQLSTSEGRYIYQLIMLAIENDCMNRIHLFGLGQPDVICYLEAIDLLQRGAPDWATLTDRWRHEADPKRGPENIKKWLAKNSLLSSVPAEVNLAIETAALVLRHKIEVGAGSLPADFDQLLNEVERITRS